MPSGFITEHTAEYVLVPDILERLSLWYEDIIPFFFWQSREGQAKARNSFDGYARLVVCYARRPKVHHVGAPEIFTTFNHLLFLHSQAAEDFGIPVLAGVPIISSFSELRMGVECAWFSLNGRAQFVGDAQVRLSKRGIRLQEVSPPEAPIAGPLDSYQLAQCIEQRALRMPWGEMIRNIGRIREQMSLRAPYGYNYWGPYMPYKPFYLAFVDRY